MIESVVSELNVSALSISAVKEKLVGRFPFVLIVRVDT